MLLPGQTKENRKFQRRWLPAILAAAVAGVAAGRVFIGPVSVVDGDSMAPTYPNGTRITFEAIHTPLKRGDVVLLDDGGGARAMKRIVGMPGEVIELYRGYVFVNSRLLREPYLPPYTFTFGENESSPRRWELRENEYFVLGDNRFWSVDSRRYGPVGRHRIEVRAPGGGRGPTPWRDQWILPSAGQPRMISGISPVG